MKISIFSTSLTALDLRDAIRVAAEVGYDAMEIGCFAPHLTLEMAEARMSEVCAWLREANLPISALSLTVSYTAEDEMVWRANVDETCRFIRLCEKFGTRIVKTMPGPPGSAQATDKHWDRFGDRIYLTHVKDSLFNIESGEYVPMGKGKMDYGPIIERLRAIGYDGYLSVECLYAQAKRENPRGSIAHDLAVLRELLLPHLTGI